MFHSELVDVTFLTEVEQRSKISFLTLYSHPALILLFRKSSSRMKTVCLLLNLSPAYSSLWSSELNPLSKLPNRFHLRAESLQWGWARLILGRHSQSKFLESINLKFSSRIRKGIRYGLPATGICPYYPGWITMANYSSSHSVFQIKLLDKELEEHQGHKLKPKGNNSKLGQLQVCTSTMVIAQCIHDTPISIVR